MTAVERACSDRRKNTPWRDFDACGSRCGVMTLAVFGSTTATAACYISCQMTLVVLYIYLFTPHAVDRICISAGVQRLKDSAVQRRRSLPENGVGTTGHTGLAEMAVGSRGRLHRWVSPASSGTPLRESSFRRGSPCRRARSACKSCLHGSSSPHDSWPENSIFGLSSEIGAAVHWTLLASRQHVQ